MLLIGCSSLATQHYLMRCTSRSGKLDAAEDLFCIDTTAALYLHEHFSFECALCVSCIRPLDEQLGFGIVDCVLALLICCTNLLRVELRFCGHYAAHKGTATFPCTWRECTNERLQLCWFRLEAVRTERAASIGNDIDSRSTHARVVRRDGTRGIC
eukprot:6212517-Pleurochrysis_carterae.AAC.15